ncbi:MAG: DUF3021 domain-containing protein [Clostridium sp.]|nr:DUF3021 domain-containing protein [Clostridium sp.]
MKRIKKITLISLQGMAISCMIYTLIGIIFDNVYQGNYLLENYAYTKQAVASMIIGIAFSAPSEIYSNEKLPFSFQFLFHMGIGCIVYFITALYVGWLPVSFGIGKCILIALLQLSVAFLIWLFFSFHYRRLAKSMNEKIKQNTADDNNMD